MNTHVLGYDNVKLLRVHENKKSEFNEVTCLLLHKFYLFRCFIQFERCNVAECYDLTSKMIQ